MSAMGAECLLFKGPQQTGMFPGGMCCLQGQLNTSVIFVLQMCSWPAKDGSSWV